MNGTYRFYNNGRSPTSDGRRITIGFCTLSTRGPRPVKWPVPKVKYDRSLRFSLFFYNLKGFDH